MAIHLHSKVRTTSFSRHRHLKDLAYPRPLPGNYNLGCSGPNKGSPQHRRTPKNDLKVTSVGSISNRRDCFGGGGDSREQDVDLRKGNALSGADELSVQGPANISQLKGNECKSRHCLPRLPSLDRCFDTRVPASVSNIRSVGEKHKPAWSCSSFDRGHRMSEAESLGRVVDAAALRWHSEAVSIAGSHAAPLLTYMDNLCCPSHFQISLFPTCRSISYCGQTMTVGRARWLGGHRAIA